MLPSLQLLEKVSQEIMSVPNRRKESKRGVHYGLFLLGYKSGLRISEAVKFDLNAKTSKGLYRISKTKGKKERFVYIPKKVIRELKKNNWRPNQTNRWNFYHFLKKIKRELNISKEIELTPHTLRRAFATYQAESGLPLPLLQKLLGHASIRTTALYWRDIYGEEEGDIGSILAGGDWLENQEPSSRENFPEKKGIYSELPQTPNKPKPIFIDQKTVIPNKNSIQQGNYLPTTKLTEKSRELINKISPKPPEKFLLDAIQKNNQIEINQQLALIPNKRKKINEKEQILLEKIKSLEGQLRKNTIERNNLKIDKEQAEAIAEQEKQRADHYQQQLKTIVKAFKQWQKINYYQQLEKEKKTELEAKVEHPPSWKSNK